MTDAEKQRLVQRQDGYFCADHHFPVIYFDDPACPACASWRIVNLLDDIRGENSRLCQDVDAYRAEVADLKRKLAAHELAQREGM